MQPIHHDEIKTVLLHNQDWLLERILAFAVKHGYAANTSTLIEAWRLSITGLTASIISGLCHFDRPPAPEAADNLSEDPVAQFGIVEAQRHRERGISLSMFLGLMKYYRQAYLDLIQAKLTTGAGQSYALSFVSRVFDKIEIGFCTGWSGATNNQVLHELQLANRLMTNEKTKYLTIFESIPNPVIILNEASRVDDMNMAAARLLSDRILPGSQYYSLPHDRHPEAECAEHYEENEPPVVSSSCFGGHKLASLLPWLESEVEDFYASRRETMSAEKKVTINGREATFRVTCSRNLDISGKFAGTVIILDDITSLKRVLEEVKTLRGFLPICAGCKSIRDDKGYWQQVETYVAARSEVMFSHSICPDCIKRLYPELDCEDERPPAASSTS